jgi:cytochrome c oxidase subunit I
VAVPSAIGVFNWTTTMYRGSVSYDTPMLYALLYPYSSQSAAAPASSSPPMAIDVRHRYRLRHRPLPLRDSGGMAMIYLSDIHFWFPKITRRLYPEAWAKFAALMIF